MRLQEIWVAVEGRLFSERARDQEFREKMASLIADLEREHPGISERHLLGGDRRYEAEENI